MAFAGVSALAFSPGVAAGAQVVNPERAPVIVTARIPRDVQGVPLRLRVTRPSGATVYVGTFRPVDRPVSIFRWAGRAGIGGLGPPVSDGRYRLVVETARGRTLDTKPVSAVIDRTPPDVRLFPPSPRIPAAPIPRVGLVVRDDGASPEHPVVARTVVRTLADVPVAATAWRPAGKSVVFPRSLGAGGHVGALVVTVQAKDAAGNRGDSARTVIGVPGPPRPARVVTRVRTDKPLVALTIDDGYDAGAVASMLSTATRMRAPLTMCFNGSSTRNYDRALRAQLRAAAAAGWLQVCNHGYSHAQGSRLSPAQLRSDLTKNVIWDQTVGQTSLPFYRPPYGETNRTIQSVAGNLGFRYVTLWDVDTNDWRHRNAAGPRNVVLSQSRRGSIVLMHAIPSSAAALPGIITGLRARGLQPTDLGNLFAAGVPTR